VLCAEATQITAVYRQVIQLQAQRSLPGKATKNNIAYHLFQENVGYHSNSIN
jgi:hypothetical protein